MKLTDLEPQFIRFENDIADKSIGKKLPDCTTQWGGFPIKIKRHVATLENAQGIDFLCPLCFTKNNGSVGTHSCNVTFRNRGVADEDGSHNVNGISVRWDVSGTGYNDLTISPSVLLQGGCGWHGFITNGEVSII